MIVGGAYVAIGAQLTNREDIRRMTRIVAELRELAVDMPWLTTLEDMAADLDHIRKGLTCVPSRR